jgi:hypothetical protein
MKRIPSALASFSIETMKAEKYPSVTSAIPETLSSGAPVEENST